MFWQGRVKAKSLLITCRVCVWVCRLWCDLCYDGVIVTCYNQVTRHGRKRKGKNILLFFLLFVEEDSFLPLEQRVELWIDLDGTTTLWENQDVT
jgi:hypothetical protein